MKRDTNSPSPDVINQMDEEEVIYNEDVIEVIDPDSLNNEEAIKIDPEKEDATLVFTGHKSGSVFCGFLSKAGKIAVTGSEEDKAYVWDTTTGEIILNCTDHKDSIIFAEFNFDETYLATGDMSGIIQLWRLSDKSMIWNYNMGDATWMKWHMAANVLIAGSVNGEIFMWKVPDGDCKVLQGFGNRTEAGVILPDGKRLAVGYEDGTIRVFDLKSNNMISTIPSNVGHNAAITALDCYIDNNLILSAAVDGKTILSMAHTGKIISILQDLNSEQENDMEDSDRNWVETVAFCKDPTFQVAATGSLNGEIFIWDIPKQMLRHKIEQEGGISKILWKGTTSLLFSGGLDGILRCFDARNGLCLHLFTGHSKDILDLHISEEGQIVLTTSDDFTARIFDISNLF
ncbi:PREDICTED: angio-associated migratory cell protein [Polistes dominula]|uniref:Angio-associated migratory cell protein n=1 Tax=Polistes dominula TaxID=743375 RepID=A0ABM1IP00_POLDO|nr:PREDICTED: angio-associated migratory cell protein [Polistes dominula]XP_015181938.1 PREDICTED: angio-associated migratory cell protein [Polistes dominula]